MTQSLLTALLALPLASAALADGGARPQLGAARASSLSAAASAGPEAASESAGAVFDGAAGPSSLAVSASEDYHRTNLYADTPELAHAGPIAPPGPQLPASDEAKKTLPKWAMYAAGGGLGFLQGLLFGGPVGALAGAAVGLAATHYYMKQEPGTAIGISAGSIIGTFLGGPIGGLVGALVGGLIGHFLSKLF